jgi:hypothetical protein
MRTVLILIILILLGLLFISTNKDYVKKENGELPGFSLME